MCVKRIHKESIPDQVFRELKQAILDGTFPVGSKLPSENELCAQLGVSRPSVKSAVQRLAVLGLVETRAGDGSYVKDFDLAALFNQISDVLITEENKDDFNEYRVQMDLLFVRLAMERITPQELDELFEIAGQMDRCLQKRDEKAFHSLDFRFHASIVHAAKKSFLEQIFYMTRDLYERFLLEGSRDLVQLYHEHPDEYCDIHRELALALRDKNYGRCEQLLTIGNIV